MAQLSAPSIAVLVAGVVLYVAIWLATRKLSRVGKILVRLAPLGLVIPAMVYLSSLWGVRVGLPPTALPPQGPMLERDGAQGRGPGSSGSAAPQEARPEASKEAGEARQRAESEAHRRAEQAEAARRSAEIPKARSARPELPPPGPTSPTPPPGAATLPEGAWDVVPVFYGTDRVRKEEPKRILYAGERARRLELGRALVTVPRTHQVPNIERPFAVRIPFTDILLYEQAEDPQQHFTLRELKALTRDQFLELVRERIGGGLAYRDQAVVFVHGYNTTFDYALFRTAQMAYDLKFDSASFLYSWPSEAGLIGYNYDRESSEQAEPYLREYLELVLKETGAKSVSVIAHSMGNMPLLRVLQALGPSLPTGVQLNQIILAAPDVDRNLFENLAANIKQYGRGITLYCSSNDRAMAAARRVAGLWSPITAPVSSRARRRCAR